MSWVQAQTMLMIYGLKGLEGALHVTGSHLSAFEGFYVFTSIQWSTLLRAQECCSVHPRPGRSPTRLQQHAKKQAKTAKTGPDPQLAETCRQCEHFCYGIKIQSKLRFHHGPPCWMQVQVPQASRQLLMVSLSGDFSTQRNHTRDKNRWWRVIYTRDASVP